MLFITITSYTQSLQVGGGTGSPIMYEDDYSSGFTATYEARFVGDLKAQTRHEFTVSYINSNFLRTDLLAVEVGDFDRSSISGTYSGFVRLNDDLDVRHGVVGGIGFKYGITSTQGKDHDIEYSLGYNAEWKFIYVRASYVQGLLNLGDRFNPSYGEFRATAGVTIGGVK